MCVFPYAGMAERIKNPVFSFLGHTSHKLWAVAAGAEPLPFMENILMLFLYLYLFLSTQYTSFLEDQNQVLTSCDKASRFACMFSTHPEAVSMSTARSKCFIIYFLEFHWGHSSGFHRTRNKLWLQHNTYKVWWGIPLLTKTPFQDEGPFQLNPMGVLAMFCNESKLVWYR